MAIFSLRLADDVAAKFDAAAADVGGRSALLRRLIRQALDADAEQGRGMATDPQARGRTSRRVEIRLTETELDALNREASALGIKRTDWIITLLRRRLNNPASLPREERAAVAQAWRQLNRIGINLNQATRALNASVMVESGMDVAGEAARVVSFRAEIMTALAGLGAALKGDLRYWEISDV